ncbi:hypothetical protein [Pseudomonas serbica]
MKILCVHNNLNDIKEHDTVLHLKRYISMPDGEVELEVGKQYVVYGIEFRENCPWFYICTEDYDDYPKPFSASFFDVIDKRFSMYWELSFEHEHGDKPQSKIAFSEWASDPSYYEKLIEGEDLAISTFAKYRTLIDQEQI